MNEVLSTEEVAALLHCAPTTVESRARAGDLPGLLFGNAGYVFPRAQLMEALNELAAREAAKRKEPPKPVATTTAPARRKGRTLPRLVD